MADDEFLHEVRLLQRRTRCSNFVCEEFVKTYKNFSPDPVKTRTVKTRIREFDNRAKNAAGCNYIILHGCPECNRHVYLPTDKATSCPFVKQDGNVCAHPRFDEHGKAFEVILLLVPSYKCSCIFVLLILFIIIYCTVFVAQRAFYYSIRERLKAFLRIPGFRQLLEHERLRPRGPGNLMMDTYDSPSWKKFMGDPGYPCSRIGLQGCTDGFQAHVSGVLSMKPFMLANFSLPPALRFKTQFMFLMMLLPVNAKGYGLKKYFDFAANFELNSLYHTGESGIKVKIFSLSLDTPGRHELLGARNFVVKLV